MQKSEQFQVLTFNNIQSSSLPLTMGTLKNSIIKTAEPNHLIKIFKSKQKNQQQAVNVCVAFVRKLAIFCIKLELWPKRWHYDTENVPKLV